MRKLARFVATSTLVVGCLAALLLVIAALNLLGAYGAGSALVLFGWAFGVFLTAASSACILSLLASIDERLQAAGHSIASDVSPGEWNEDEAVLREQFGAPGVKAASDDEIDADLESKLNFQRTHGRS
ncbi:hypothetical protein [Brevundimonas sp.]|uniref:hypothetical protein n=1 Tax=Brevundimonas sp. TaxID=1871086 RepID=UPI003F6F8A2D